MPLAFASLLGGLTTLIGTPPNIIISNFRQEEAGAAFKMFDFAPVGIGVAVVGILFIAFVGWRLIPTRQAPLALGDTLHIEDYMTEVRVPEGSRFIGKLVRDLEDLAEEDVAIVGMVHKGVVYGAPSSYEVIDEGDIFIVEADPEDLKLFVDSSGLVLEVSRDMGEDFNQTLSSDEVMVVEAIVDPDSMMRRRTARSLHLHAAYGVNLLGVSRRGTRLARRLGRIVFRAGDVLLLQGRTELVQAALPRLGLLPLAERALQIGQRRRLFFPLTVFIAAVLLAAFNIVPIQISFVGGAAILLLTRFLTLQAAYQAIDWPVIILLGAMIPVGEALDTTGGATRIAMVIAEIGGSLPGVGHTRDSARDDDAIVGGDQQCCCGDFDGTYRDRRSSHFRRKFRSVSDGRRYRSLVGVSDSHRTSVEHHCDGAGWISIRRLLAVGIAVGNGDRRGGDSADHVGLAVGDLADYWSFVLGMSLVGSRNGDTLRRTRLRYRHLGVER